MFAVKMLAANMSMVNMFMAKVPRTDQIIPRCSKMCRLFHTRANRAGLNRSRPAIKLVSNVLCLRVGGCLSGEKKSQNIEDKFWTIRLINSRLYPWQPIVNIY